MACRLILTLVLGMSFQEVLAQLEDQMLLFEGEAGDNQILEIPQIDLNKDNLEFMILSGTLTPQEAELIINHRQQYGAFESPYELQVVIQDSNRLRQIIPQVKTISKGLDAKKSHRIDIQGSQRFKKINDEHLLLHPAIRFRMDIYPSPSTQLNVVMESDYGEAYFSNHRPYLFDYNSISYSSFKNAHLNYIIGNHQIHVGEGLMRSSRNIGSSLGGVLSIKGPSPHIIAHKSSIEQSDLWGFATDVGIKNWRVLLSTGLGFGDANTNPTNDTIQSITNSGLHISERELARRKNYYYWSSTLSINRSFRRSKLALSLLDLKTQKFYQPNAGPDKLRHLTGAHFLHVSVSGEWNYQNNLLFAEMVFWTPREQSYLIGFLKALDRKTDIAIHHRRYTPVQNWWGNAYGKFSTSANELGTSFLLQFQASKYHAFSFAFEEFQRPWFTYGKAAELTQGRDLIFNFVKKSGQEQLAFRARLVQNGNFGFRVDQIKTNFRVHWEDQVTNALKWSLRMEVSYFEVHWSRMYYSDLQYKSKNFRMYYRVYRSDVADGHAAIYAFESDLVRRIAIARLGENAWTHYLILEKKSDHHLTVRLKIKLSDLDDLQESNQFDLKLQIIKEWTHG